MKWNQEFGFDFNPLGAIIQFGNLACNSSAIPHGEGNRANEYRSIAFWWSNG